MGYYTVRKDFISENIIQKRKSTNKQRKMILNVPMKKLKSPKVGQTIEKGYYKFSMAEDVPTKMS